MSEAPCLFCGTAIEPGDEYPTDAYGEVGRRHHRECMVRAIAGSIGHQLGLCGCNGGPGILDDPPGWPPRQAAAVACKLAVDIANLPEEDRPAALADARAKIRLLGPDVGADCIFGYVVGVRAN